MVWTGTIGLITMREPKSIFGNNAEEKDTLENGGDTSLRKEFDNKDIRYADPKIIGHRHQEGSRTPTIQRLQM